MSVVRMIYVKVNPSATAAAERVWKEDCAPLMIKQPGLPVGKAAQIG
jgi:hypothetical protein